MRFWAFALAVEAFLFPLALVAQHTAAPAGSHGSPAGSHASATASSGAHVSSIPSSHTHGAGSANGAQALHPPAGSTRSPKTTSVKDREMSKSVTKSKPERRGLFSFLRKRQPIQPDLQEKCKPGHCSTNNTIAPTQLVAPVPSQVHARLGCTVVPGANPGIPCNPLAPCCP